MEQEWEVQSQVCNVEPWWFFSRYPKGHALAWSSLLKVIGWRRFPITFLVPFWKEDVDGSCCQSEWEFVSFQGQISTLSNNRWNTFLQKVVPRWNNWVQIHCEDSVPLSNWFAHPGLLELVQTVRLMETLSLLPFYQGCFCGLKADYFWQMPSDDFWLNIKFWKELRIRDRRYWSRRDWTQGRLMP